MTSLSRENFYTAIAQNIAQDTQACEALLQLLSVEREQLKNRELDALDATIAAKAQWLGQLEHSAQQRTLWIQQSPLTAQQSLSDAWQQLLTDCAKPDLAEQWQYLKKLLQQCRDDNEINGKLISRSQTTFKRLVNILRGQEEQTQLYTGRGAKSESCAKQQLGQA